jgi:hypothetical protein
MERMSEAREDESEFTETTTVGMNEEKGKRG